jgi:hypothetical protein
MESHCSICQRLVAASREMRVLEIVQRIHFDKWHAGDELVPHRFTM